MVVIPMVGLAIDAAVMYWVKAKLSAAVDASALAGARALNVTGTFATRQSVGTSAADEWFAANFPPGFLGVSISGGGPSVAVAQTTSAIITVTVSATAIVPTYFMRILGFTQVNVSASAQSTRRNLNIMLVLDRSGSMGPPPTGSNACPTMIANAQSFVSNYIDGFDTMGLVTFSTSANLDYAPTTHFKSNSPSLSDTIGQIGCTGATNATQGLETAWTALTGLGSTGALNVIVFFTDGQPNVVVSDNWPIKTQSDTRWGTGLTNSYSSSVWTPASSCNSSLTSLSGGLTILLATGQTPAQQGYTGGLYSYAPAAINASGTTLMSYSGCSFDSGPDSELNARQDIAYIPSTDKWGNSTTDSGYKSLDTFPTSNPYSGQIRPDEQTLGVMAAAFNTADYFGRQIRTNGTYPVVIYTIGLDGAPDVAVDQEFLMRMANDPNAGTGVYDPTLLTGKFALAPTPSQLTQAFDEIASQILRLSK